MLSEMPPEARELHYAGRRGGARELPRTRHFSEPFEMLRIACSPLAGETPHARCRPGVCE